MNLNQKCDGCRRGTCNGCVVHTLDEERIDVENRYTLISIAIGLGVTLIVGWLINCF